MRLVITLPNRKPTTMDVHAISAAVGVIKIGMALSKTPPWSIESDAERLTTREAATMCGLTMDGFKKAAARVGVTPAAKVGNANVWDAADVDRVKGKTKAARGQLNSLGGG